MKQENGLKTSLVDDLCIVCKEESSYGAHGIRNWEIYDEYYCEKCYNTKNRINKKDVEDGNTIADRRSSSEDNEIRSSMPVFDMGDGINLSVEA